MLKLDWIADFENPPANYRPMPLWVWNGEMSKERIAEMLGQMAEMGMGGVFIHPRAGLVTEYLSEEWFELWAFALHECERLGIECHIYDENSFPSGFGGGNVMANNPCVAAVALVKRTWRQPIVPWREAPETLAAFRVTTDGAYIGPATPEDMAHASMECPITVFDLKQEAPGWWQAGFPYVDLGRAETTDAFLASTHEKYRQKLGAAFGKTIKYVFTDEPTMERSQGIPFSRFLMREFLVRYGYKIEENIALLYYDLPGAEAVRFDYFRLLDHLFTQNFVRRIHDWCERSGLLFTGHFNEHTWPKPDGIPSNMSALRWMQAPGNDLLAFQFTPGALERNALYHLNLKELSSVANQLGRERVLVESCGGGGYEMTPNDFKPLEDFLLVHGVNLLSPHLSYETLSGVRKYDWPQTISDHAPWWRASKTHQDHIARCVTALIRGKEINRVLVLQPDTTAWVRLLDIRDIGSTENQPENPHPLRLSQESLLLELSRRGVDYDLGCEMILEEMGKASDARLKCGERSYELVVIPPETTVLLSSTVRLLGEFLASRGRVISSTSQPTLVDGRPSAAIAVLRDQFAERWSCVEGLAEIAESVASAVPPRVCVSSATHPDLLWRRCELPDGSVLFFFANPWDRPFSGRVELEGQSLASLDSLSGSIAPFESTPARAGRQAFTLDLPQRGHLLLHASPLPVSESRRLPTSDWKEIALGQPAVNRVEENRLLLDCCDLEVGGEIHKGISTIMADQLNWAAQGWGRNPWSFSIQYKKVFIDAKGSPGSGFSVRYPFQIAAGDSVIKTLRLAVERPHLYEIKVNGTALSSDGAKQWFDEEIRSIDAGPLLRRGLNEVVLTASPFHVLCEIAPVYLLGEFALRTASPGFEIVDDVALRPGDWTTQGLPFYPARVRYEWDFSLNAPAECIQLELAEWNGSAAYILVDGIQRGTLVHQPYISTIRGSFAEGNHRLSVEVAGNLRNQMGPHLSKGVPTPWTWGIYPSEGAPDGNQYHFSSTGLTEIRLRQRI